MTPEVRAKMQEIEALIHKACQGTFQSLDRATITERIRALIAAWAGAHAARLDYHTDWTPDDVCTLVPHDLFTGLILTGVPLADAVPFLARDCHLAAFPSGTYRFGDRFTFTPPTAAEFITIQFSTAEALGV